MNESRPKKKQGIYSTVKEDIRQAEFSKELKRDLDESIVYYLDDQQKEKLAKKGFFMKTFYLIWWFTKGIFSKLTPVRRILFVVAIFLHLANNGSQNGTSTIGGLILIFLLLQELKEKIFAKDELEDGHSVQKALMPTREPVIPGWSAWLYSEPSNDVGGDLVDFIAMTEKRFGISLGDVSGKGLGAALYMAKLQATIRALVLDDFKLSHLAAKINRIFNRDCESRSFASLIFLELQAHSDRVHYFNAGHFPPILVHSGTVTMLEKGDPALGLTANAHFQEKQFECVVGDWVVLYSDGITEAMDEAGRFYGEDRLIAFIEKMDGQDCHHIGQAILEEIKTFQGDSKPHDDISLIILKRTEALVDV